jgi:ribosome-associated toxin RatA of RatAB toxin-antitoxin module
MCFDYLISKAGLDLEVQGVKMYLAVNVFKDLKNVWSLQHEQVLQKIEISLILEIDLFYYV